MEKKLLVNAAILKQLEELRLNLSHLWLLEQFYFGNDEIQLESVYRGLERKELILNGIITPEGKKLYESIIVLDGNTEVNTEVLIGEISQAREQKADKFEEWWKKYPSGDSWKDEATGKEWHGGRSLKNSKPKCKKLYLAILADNYTHEEMLEVIDYELAQRKKKSRATGDNRLAYMSNTHAYLYQRIFEGYIDMMRNDKKWKNPKEAQGEPTTNFNPLEI